MILARKKKIFIYGARGHARVVMDIVERQGLYDIGFLVDDDPELKELRIKGYPVIGGKEDLLGLHPEMTPLLGIVAIGCNQTRQTVVEWLAVKGFEFVSAIHPKAVIGRDALILPGAVVMAGCVVSPDAIIGEHAIVNTGATVDHDCRIGSFAHIGPGAHLCGNVTVGTNSFVCAGATVIPNLIIGRNVVVGAGSTVIDDVPDNVTVVGSPTRIVKKSAMPTEEMVPASHPINAAT